MELSGNIKLSSHNLQKFAVERAIKIGIKITMSTKIMKNLSSPLTCPVYNPKHDRSIKFKIIASPQTITKKPI